MMGAAPPPMAGARVVACALALHQRSHAGEGLGQQPGVWRRRRRRPREVRQQAWLEQQKRG